MASGFITYSNGKDWSSRWTCYDLVLQTIMSSLSDEGKYGELKNWLRSILPKEGDIESGYCFYPADGGDSVHRIIDTRLMKKEYAELFWETVQSLAEEKTDLEDPAPFFVQQLYAGYRESLKDPAVEPNPFDPQTEALEDRQIGPGWD